MKLTLGTAQLGMVYGVVNRTGKPCRADAVAIVRRARSEGVTTFDTARAYSDAEEVLGEAFGGNYAGLEVITKLHLPGLSPSSDESTVRSAVGQSISASSRALGIPRLPVVLLHNWQHYSGWNGAAWKHLTDLQNSGHIGSLGASVYEPAEAFAALADPRIMQLQIPFNVLDWRWKAACVNRTAAQHSKVRIYARSALLQGILVHPAEAWPEVAEFDSRETVEHLKKLAQRYERNSVTDLCLAYVRAQDWLESVVVGCETEQQLDENLATFRRAPLSQEQCAELEREIPKAPAALLNPSLWPSARGGRQP